MVDHDNIRRETVHDPTTNLFWVIHEVTLTRLRLDVVL